MLYLNSFFKDFNEFKNIFGLRECGNGNKQRQNNILMKCLKDRKFMHELRVWNEFTDKECADSYAKTSLRYLARQFKKVDSMPSFKSWFHKFISDGYISNLRYSIRLTDSWSFFSSKYYLDDCRGVCVDGSSNAIRYVNRETGKIFKMKTGRFINKCLDEYEFHIPEQLRVWIGEELSADWATKVLNETESQYTLVVDDDFKSIYTASKCAKDMGSCMGHGRGNHASFYNDAVTAKAASLRDEDGTIVARCVIWTDVTDVRTGEKYRLAERQYVKHENNILKRQLVTALIKAGEIDGYKNIGVSCHDNCAFVSNTGTDWSDKDFRIECNLGFRDVVSYQDSFVYYDKDNGYAYNHDNHEYDYELDTTDDYFDSDDENHDGEVWSEWHDCYIDEDSACYVERRDSYFYDDEVVYVDGEYEFVEDCFCCEECDCWCLKGDGYYSELLDKYFCSESCVEDAEYEYKEQNWTYCDWDEEYYEDETILSTYMFWNPIRNKYSEAKIKTEDIAYALCKGELVFYAGKYYDMWDEDFIPYGFNRKNELEIPKTA